MLRNNGIISYIKIKGEYKMKTKQNLDKTVIASFEFEHNDGDQIWSDTTTYYKKNDGTYEKEYIDGYYGESCTSPITLDEIISRMKEIEHEVRKKQETISIYGINNPITRGGYSITKNLDGDIEKGETGIDSDFDPNIRKILLQTYQEAEDEITFD